MLTTGLDRPRTAHQRSVEATRQLRTILGLGDLKLLATALAEVAAEEAAKNPRFATKIQDSYRELESLVTVEQTRAPTAARPRAQLVPIRTFPGWHDPLGPLDPYYLQRLYGDNQLALALDGYSLAKLKEAAAIVEQRFPGTKPKNRARKDSVTAYIVEKVTGSPPAQHD